MSKPPKYIKDFKVPEWWECQWRQIACGRDECRMCGRINRSRQKHIDKGEDPDSMEAAFEDIKETFAEVKEMLSKDAKKMGIDLNNLPDEIDDTPKAEEFPLYNQVMKWYTLLMTTISNAHQSGEECLESEPAKDLMWYKNTILVKTYRQLCNRFELDKGDDIADVDYEYTRYVLAESIKIVKKSLEEIIKNYSTLQEVNLKLALSQIKDLEAEILTI